MRSDPEHYGPNHEIVYAFLKRLSEEDLWTPDFRRMAAQYVPPTWVVPYILPNEAGRYDEWLSAGQRAERIALASTFSWASARSAKRAAEALVLGDRLSSAALVAILGPYDSVISDLENPAEKGAADA